MAFIYVSAIKMSASGAVQNSDNCTGSKTGTGKYQVVLGSSIGPDEALILIQPANGSLLDWVISSSVLQGDGVTVDIDFAALSVFPTDSAFSFIAYKFQAEP